MFSLFRLVHRSITCYRARGNVLNHSASFSDVSKVIVTSAVGAQLGTDVSGARIVRVLDNEIRHEYYAIEDLPETIDL